MLASLDRADIASRLPHAGRMCLLDRVVHWDEHSIRCTAVSHRDADNPLRKAAGLPTMAGIEYAAQAAAVHGALRHGATVPRNGVLAALKNVVVTHAWLHDVAGEIVIEVTLLHSDPAGALYRFAVCAGTERVLSGQFTLMYIDDTERRQEVSV